MNVSELAYSVHNNSLEKITSEKISALKKSGQTTAESGLADSDFSNILSEVLNTSTDSSSVINSPDPSVLADSISETLTTVNNVSGNSQDNDILEQLEDLAESLTSGVMDKEEENMDVMSILTDAEKAKEYLSSQSGRQVLARMAENQIAGIVTGSS